jgi:hypothetical protein
MIAAAFLSVALYFTGTLVVRVISIWAQKRDANFTTLAILSALSWGAFYYFA